MPDILAAEAVRLARLLFPQAHRIEARYACMTDSHLLYGGRAVRYYPAAIAVYLTAVTRKGCTMNNPRAEGSGLKSCLAALARCPLRSGEAGSVEQVLAACGPEDIDGHLSYFWVYGRDFNPAEVGDE